jgi:hypothetical protein
MQRFMARYRFQFANGATGWAPGGPFDGLGPFAKVEACPVGEGMRRTVYAQGYPDTYWSIPAACRINGKRVKGYLRVDDGPDGRSVEFIRYDRQG